MTDVMGQVFGGAAPVEGATVTLWGATASAPVQLGLAVTDSDGHFSIDPATTPMKGASLYVVAKGGRSSADKAGGDNERIALLTVLGSDPHSSFMINELTTVASVWTHAQFIDGAEIKGHALGLRIAAGNVPNLVDLTTGGLGPVIQDPLNSSQTTALATLNTLGDLLAGCVTRVRGDACERLFAAATPRGGTAPTDTLMAIQNIASDPSHQAQDLFTLLNEFYPVPDGKLWREVPFVPYLSFAPSAWTLSLVFAGGGLNSLGGIAIDGDGNMWSDNNFMPGAQSTIWGSFGGGLSKIAPNGRPLSPMTVGFRGGGIDGPGFGIAIGADDKVWATSLAAQNISVFDRETGKPLSPDTGYNFEGQLGSMQGIITTPNGDVWALDNENSQIIHLPQGDASKGRIFGRTVDGKPVDGTLQMKGPFHLAVDQQDRIWVTNSDDTVTRFPANDPANAERIKVGFVPRGVAIDSLGNAWVANCLGHPGTKEKLALVKGVLKAKLGNVGGRASKADADGEKAQEWVDLYDLAAKFPGGDVSLVRPDGTVAGTFDGGGSIIGPWGIAIDGNDNVWVADALGRTITHLCGARLENCPPGAKTGDPISPPGGYLGGVQITTDVAIDPAGNVWVANNWDRPDEGFKKEPEPSLSTRFGGNGTVVFYGLAKPVKTPLIGPPRPL
jgi:DNA-binding beta-propeller fold protein YncE